jgi:predicted nucleic acid-binding protein
VTGDLYYFDASFLVPLIRNEATSGRVVAHLASVAQENLVTSAWALVECRSGLAREVRMGAMPMDRFQRCTDQLDDLIGRSFELIVPEQEDYRSAATLLNRPELGLRAGDAMHVAISGRIGADLLLSLDRRLIAASNASGVPAGKGFESP